MRFALSSFALFSFVIAGVRLLTNKIIRCLKLELLRLSGLRAPRCRLPPARGPGELAAAPQERPTGSASAAMAGGSVGPWSWIEVGRPSVRSRPLGSVADTAAGLFGSLPPAQSTEPRYRLRQLPPKPTTRPRCSSVFAHCRRAEIVTGALRWLAAGPRAPPWARRLGLRFASSRKSP